MNYATDSSTGTPTGTRYRCHVPYGFGGFWGQGATPQDALGAAKKATHGHGHRIDWDKAVVYDTTTNEEVERALS